MQKSFHLPRRPVHTVVLLLRLARLLLALAGCASLYAGAASAAGGSWTIEIPAARFERADVVSAGGADKARRANNLAGTVGRYDYDVNVASDGWYELYVAGHLHDVEVLIDPHGAAPAKARYYVPGSPSGFNGKNDKIGNFWLTRGRHTIRLQRYYWTGFPQITGLQLRPSDGRLATSVHVSRTTPYAIWRKGRCEPLEIEYGPRPAGAALQVSWVNAATSHGIRSFAVTLPATTRFERITWPVPCEDEGFFVLYFGGAGSEKLTNRDVHQVHYQVVDTTKAGPAPGELRKTLVQEIDFTASEPDYAGGETRVVRKAFGSYRESDDAGWLDFLHSPLRGTDFSWFAYRLSGIAPQQPHLVEVDYPDDANRTFALSLRESNPLSYPVTGGVDSGGEFPLTGRMQTHTLLFWPRARDPRLVVLNAKNGRHAAAARARVYRIEGPLPPLLPRGTPGRHYANWYEEGTNFLSMYGGRDESAPATYEALQRWAQALAYMGGNVLWPTVSIYSFALYPSTFNRAFSQPWRHDLLRQALLVAERHGMKVIPELHPRADELSWAHAGAPDPKPQLLLSRNGDAHKDLPPFHNPLFPANHEWYLGMIGELASRYRDSPALMGVSLRFMQWKNPALHNFHSLDWGYDDYTAQLFEKDTGVRVPADGDDPKARARSRYRWLMVHAREAWIEWRCRKVAELVTRARDRLRAVRPDLQLFIPVFPMTEAGNRYNAGTAWLREAGLDARLLGQIEGVVLVNALHTYGRRADPGTNALLRGNLVRPEPVHALDAPGRPASFLPTASYFEATDAVVPPEKLGFPPNTKKTWMSAVVNPAGRIYLERFAVLLAATDAAMLGDGGNAYTLGQPELRAFLAEYRRLPALPFRTRTATRAPAAVRDAEHDGGYYVYAVNRTARRAAVSLAFSGSGALRRLSTGATVSVEGDTAQVELAPFELVAYRGTGSLRLKAASAGPVER